MAKELLPDALWARITPRSGGSRGKQGTKRHYEHRADFHLAFLQLGCALFSLRFLG